MGFFLPFFSGAALLCLPDFCVNMISSSESFTLIGHHYGTVIGVFLCVAAGYGVTKLGRRITDRWGGQRNVLVLSWALLATCVGAGSSGFHMSDWDPLPHHDTLTEAIDMVPPQASVACSENLFVHLSKRLNACDNTMLQWRFAPEDRFEALTRFDYIVFDVNPAFFYSGQIREWATRLLTHPDYITLLNDRSTVVFERRTKGLMDDFWKGNPPL